MAAGTKKYVDLLQVYRAASPLPQVTISSVPQPTLTLRPLFQVESRLIAKYKQRLECPPAKPSEILIRFQFPSGQQVEELIRPDSRGFTLLQLFERRHPDRTRAPVFTFQNRTLAPDSLIHQSVTELGLSAGSIVHVAFR